MTYLGKKSEEDDQDSDVKNNNVVNLVKTQDDILKQSIKTVGYEDTSVFFVQSGFLHLYILDPGWSELN